MTIPTAKFAPFTPGAPTMTESEVREAIASVAWEAYTGYVTRIPWEEAPTYKRLGHYRIADAIMSAFPLLTEQPPQEYRP